MPEPLPALLPEDLARLAFVHEAALAPDGARVAFPVRRIDLEANAYRSAIHVVPFDGSAPSRQWTAGGTEDSGPRWSPDGSRLAFLSDRGPVPEGRTKAPKNVFVIPSDGGEARQLTRLADDCADLAWAPDGSGLLIAVKDPGERAADDAPKVYDRLRYRSNDAGLFDLRRRHLWWVPLAGEPRRLTDGDHDDGRPAISPDGRLVAFVSNRTADRDRNTVADLWVVPLSGGEARRITDERGQYGEPAWSPDGRSIACFGTAIAIGAGASNARLWRFPASGGPGVDLLGEWDRPTGSHVSSDVRGAAPSFGPLWTSDGARIIFVGSDQGSANLYSCSSDGGDVRAETRGAHQVVSASVDREARRFAGVVATATSPGEVVAGEIGGAIRPLTALNGELLEARHLACPRRVEFAGADGWTIEGWLLEPRGFDPQRKWPLVLEVHGGPHSTYGHAYFHEFQVLAGRGYAVLYTNPRGSHAYGERFVRASVGDWGGKDYQDLMAGVDQALSLGWVDPDRLYLTGGSYGGFMTNWIVGHTDRFKAAVTQRSISNNVSAYGTSDIGWHFWEFEMGDATPWRDGQKLVERSPLTYVANIRTPLLILHAERDIRCAIEQAEQLFAALKVLDREAVLVRYQEDTHELTRGGKPRNRIDHCRRIADWFDAHP